MIIAGLLRRVTGLLAMPARKIDALVRDAHPNWVAVFLGIVSLAAAAAIAIYVDPPGREEARPPKPPGERTVSSEEEDPAALPNIVLADIGRTPRDPSAREGALAVEAPEPAAGGASGPCDAAYAAATKAELVELLDAEVRECVRIPVRPIELDYSCLVEGDAYTVTLQYQFSGGIKGERLPFSVEYRGGRKINKTEVKVTPLTPTFRRLCREKAEMDRR